MAPADMIDPTVRPTKVDRPSDVTGLVDLGDLTSILGVNDVTSGIGLETWLAQQARLRRVLRDRFGITRIVACGLPPVHGFPALPQPLRWYLGQRASAFDRALERALADAPDAVFLSLRFTEDLSLMAEDGNPGRSRDQQ